MVTRVGGLASGMDIDSLVEKLMQAERSPLNKLQQKKQTYEWQRDAYRSVNTKLKTMDSYIADNLVLKVMNTKTASSSNSDLVSAVATGNATGNLSIEGVSKLATAARAVGTEQINATGKTKLSELQFTGTSISFKAIQADGTMAKNATKISYDANTTVEQLVSKINSSEAGVSAVFENGRLSFTAKNTGENKNGSAEIQVTSGVQDFKKLGFSTLNAAGDLATDGSNAKFTVNGISTERSTNTFSLNGYNVTLKKTFNEGTTSSQLLAAAQQSEQFAKDNLRAAITNSGVTMPVDANTLTKQYNAAKSYLDTQVATLNGHLSTKSAAYQALSSDSKEFVDSLTADQRTKLTEIDLTQDMSALNLTAEQQLKYQAIENNSADVTAVNNLSEADFKTAGEKYENLSANAKALLNDSFDPNDATGVDAAAHAELVALGADYNAVKAAKTANEELPAATSKASNIVALYGTYQTAVSNTASATNGPTTTTATSPVMLSSITNVDDMMNKIKEFVTTYNGMVKDLMAQTKESKYRDYAPLTAEQRKEMDEDEIKLWEEKAKSGLLRNDSLILNGLSNMRSLVYHSNPAIEDKRYSTLYSIGITTSKSYSDGGTLEIDEEKLRKAIEENPSAVEQLFKNNSGSKNEVIDGKKVDTRGYLTKLRESMSQLESNIEKKAGRSTMTEQQYSLGKYLIDTNSRISTWESKLKNIEDRYWKQFNAMESAINKANQQSSALFSNQQQ